MARQVINTGTSDNDPSAESVQSAFTKVNAMTLELFTAHSLGGRQIIDLAGADTIRAAFTKTETNCTALYTALSLTGRPDIDTGTALDDPTAESIRSAFTDVNTMTGALYAYVAPTAAIYVALTGNDTTGSGSVGAPYRTINKAVSFLTPGKSVVVRAGTYVEALLIGAVPSGTSWAAPTRIAAYPGETVTMRPASGNRVVEFANLQQYIEFDGIHMDATNCLYDCVKINAISSTSNAHHIRVKNAELLGAVNSSDRQFNVICTGQFAGALGGNEFINLTVHRGGNQDFSHGFYIQSPNNLVEWCDIYDCAGAGVQIYSGYVGSLPTNNIVRYNIIHDMTRNYGRHRAVQHGGGSNNKIYGNVFYNIQGGAAVSAGIYVYVGSGVEIYNNTIVGGSTGGIIVETGVTNTLIKNNIVYQNAGGNYTNRGTSTVASNNLIGPDPVFVNAGARNYRLAAGSPAIAAGTSVPYVTTDLDSTARPLGTWDIGGVRIQPVRIRTVMAWYNASWSGRFPITVDHTKVLEAVDQVVYDLALAPAAFWTAVRTDGGDIRVTTSDGTTERAREVSGFIKASSVGSLYISVGDLSTSVDRTYYVYYGNASATEPAAGATFGRNAVWASFLEVFHLDESASPATGSKASTSLASAGTTTFAQTGKLRRGVDFGGDATGAALQTAGDVLDITAASLTFTAWIDPQTLSTNSQGRILHKQIPATALNGYSFFLNTTNRLSLQIGDASAQTVVSSNTSAIAVVGGWQHVAVTYDGATARFYVGGIAVGAPALTRIPANGTTQFIIGNNAPDGGGLRPFDGGLDEVALSTSVRSANWMTTTFNNQNAPATFWTTGAAETEAPGAITDLSAVAVSSTQVDLTWTAASGATSHRVERATV